MALTVIQAPPPCGDSERAESVSPSTTLRMASSKQQQQQRPPSPGSVLLTSATSAIEQRRVTAPQPPHVSLQVTASSTMNARYLMLLLNWFVGLSCSPPPHSRTSLPAATASLGFLQAWQRLCIRDTKLAPTSYPLLWFHPSFLSSRCCCHQSGDSATQRGGAEATVEG